MFSYLYTEYDGVGVRHVVLRQIPDVAARLGIHALRYSLWGQDVRIEI